MCDTLYVSAEVDAAQQWHPTLNQSRASERSENGMMKKFIAAKQVHCRSLVLKNERGLVSMTNVKKVVSQVMWTFLIAVMAVTAIPFIAPASATTVYASDPRLPATFFAERQMNTYDRPGGSVNGFVNAQTTGKRIEAWGFMANNREYFRVSFNLFQGGRATRYIRRNDLIPSAASNATDVILPRDTRVFERSNLARQAGTVWGGQRARDRGNFYSVILATQGNAAMLVHRIDSGGGRVGWISINDMEGAVRRGDGAVWRNGQWHTGSGAGALPTTGNIRITGGDRSGRGARIYIGNRFVGSVTQGFDDRQTNGRNANPPLIGHLAIDFDATSNGARIPALLAGRVVAVQRHTASNGNLGANQYTVILEHNVGGVQFFSAYYHLRSNGRPAVGTWMNVGDRIGYQWNSHGHIKFFQGSPSPAMWGYFGGANRRDFPTNNNDFIDFDGRRLFHPIRVIQTNGQHVVNHRR